MRKLLPRRAKNTGTEPVIGGAGAKCKSVDDNQLVFDDSLEPRDRQIKHLIAAAVAIGIWEVLSSHIYSFAGKVFL